MFTEYMAEDDEVVGVGMCEAMTAVLVQCFIYSALSVGRRIFITYK